MSDTRTDVVVDHTWREPSGFLPRLARPVQRLLRSSTCGAVLMLTAAVLAIVWVNAPFGETYERFWSTPVELAVGPFDQLSGMTLREVVSEGLMAVFYTAGLELLWLALATACVGAAWLLARGRTVRALWPYTLLALACWFALHESGVHPTIAGVAFGFVTPAWSSYDPQSLGRRARALAASADSAWDDAVLTGREYGEVHQVMADMRPLAVESRSPLDRMAAALTGWGAVVIVPLFALANSGLVLSPGITTAWASNSVSLGIAAGLVVGKTAGVLGSCYLAVRLGVAHKPAGTTWAQMLGVSAAAGVGFTVALYVSGLAFSDPALTEAARLGVFSGSVVAGVVGFAILRLARGAAVEEAAPDDARLEPA